MYSLLNSFKKKPGSLFTSIQAVLVCVLLMVCSLSANAQTVVRVEDIMTKNEPFIKKNKEVLPLLANNKLSPELLAPVTINYSIIYYSSTDILSIWVDSTHGLNTVVVKDGNGTIVYTGSGNAGTYSAPNIDSGTHTVYLYTNSGSVSETINVN